MEKIDYLLNNQKCAVALEELAITDDTANWLNKYADLVEQISYGPEGLPKVAAANFEGVCYESILAFYSVYRKLDQL
jgi:hypothetical protein